MATRRIKESYGPPVIPKNATPDERQRILQEHRKHQDLVKQLNDTRIAQDGTATSLEARIAALESRPQFLAMWAGNTVIGADPVATQVYNLEVTGSTINTITFAFLSPVRTARYWAGMVNRSGTAAFGEFVINNETINGFVATPLSSGGAVINPRALATSLTVIVADFPL